MYDADGMREVPCDKFSGRVAELNELYEGVVNDRPVFPDGRWGKATLEICLAILCSAAEGREIALKHQSPVP